MKPEGEDGESGGLWQQLPNETHHILNITVFLNSSGPSSQEQRAKKCCLLTKLSGLRLGRRPETPRSYRRELSPCSESCLRNPPDQNLRIIGWG